MEHVLWIGGPPGAGKTTIATMLARRHGLRSYSADTRTWVHRDRAIAAGNEAALRWEALTQAQRWEHSTPRQMLDMSLHHERGSMVVDDVRALPRSPLVIAEGSTVPAAAITSGDADRARSLWLVPTAEHQAAVLATNSTAAGPAALYALLRDIIESEVRDNDAPMLVVDGSLGVAQMVDAVERRFHSVLARGPRASTRAERQGLLREANEAVISQVRSYFARPWAEGDPEGVTRSFVCECGDSTCTADVLLAVGVASGEPVLAPGHTSPVNPGRSVGGMETSL
jgi:hypothetical protein